jgi:acetyltransferase-like isoleucine patch superfamily enzyme
MKRLFRNPLYIWFVKFVKSKKLEYKHKNKSLKIGYLSYANSCTFGIYNTLYENVNLSEVQLGDYTYIAKDTSIFKTSIGKFCSIGPDSKIGLGKHPTKNFVSTHPAFFSTLKQARVTFCDKNYFDECEKITIGNDVWVGANVIVLDGVNISDGSIVAAGSVVTKDVPPYSIVAGIPARVIKYRFEQDEIAKLLDMKWWDMDLEILRKNYKKFHNIKMLLNDDSFVMRRK